ncbi:pyruvate dehydrogenase (acetyl-transferring) E1 component, alpha subunit [Rhinocladiella mackenziei CBS 650.93]|uniref:Pyruvate dehydrogenase E1 component subunit alpha, mitochondrial n=1 Tax=Rhinocladiella mackenziei CBS 650.93 TaxID=1442369 RepID=A0A0D2JLX0_9EURO|nr:pyruvate dehydrogenase (acetyl-transferring) E1 component, alpha subunit [Rhinocladiella mackenziei CBS 650.93]KIX10460.1 pyruvate dehydrogenase (acetyl-transferring) E1 component, alpha subunit [Rhinocladiella mackenziei CBS 650.93]
MEMAADRLYKERKIRGFCHLSLGQEAIAVGIEHAITRDDKFITAYRCHGNTLMRNGSVKSIIGELLGRHQGVSHGKGGSMHMFARNYFGGNGIVGASVPVGAGVAFAQQYNNERAITVNNYGDGAANQGQVHEAFNMAKLWNLPVIFGCENNKYGMGTSIERASAMTEYFKRGHYIPGLKIDGMDVLAVMAAIKHGKGCVLAGNGPLVYEFTTYRYAGHSMSDPGTTYRARDEIQEMRRANDPINSLRDRLIEWNVANTEELRTIEKETKAHVDREVSQAEELPEPDATARVLFEDIYVHGSEPTFMRGRTPDETYYYS